MHNAKILADSISPDGVRLTTFEVTFPRIVLAEFNTHRMFSRNSASSRAIPVKKMLKRVMENPYVPSSWGKNQKGMQASQEVEEAARDLAIKSWLGARDDAVCRVETLLNLGIHKQLTNRLLEPWLWHTVIVTATEWDNFFHLRDNEKAHPDIQTPARLMRELYEAGEPESLGYGEWHVPLVYPEDWDLLDPPCELSERELTEKAVKISCARCARVSYLTHDGKRDFDADLELYDRLLTSGHMSPFEHAARPASRGDLDRLVPGLGDDYDEKVQGYFWGNFRGWVQHRKNIPNEADILGAS